MDFNYEAYKGRYQKAKANQERWLELLYEAYDYTMPNRNSWDTRYAPGRKKGQKAYDTTAIKALSIFTSKIQAALTPPKQQWMNIVAGPQLDDVEAGQVNEALEVVTDLFFEKLHASNFDLAINESYYDLAVGTAALLVNELPEDEIPFNFEVVPIFFLYPEQGPYGRIQTVFRDIWEIPYGAIKQQWPNATVSDEMARAINEKPNELTDLVEGVVYNPDTKQYHHVLWWMHEDGLMQDIPGPSSPWVIYRWSKTATEILGRGPILTALPTIQSLNEIMYNDLISISFASNPAYYGFNDGIFNPYTARIRPGAILPINMSSLTSTSKGPLIPIENTGDLRAVQVSMEDLRNQINQLLYANALGDPNGPVRTATEISLRQQALLEEIGPAFGRLQVEMLMPLTNRCLYIMGKKGMIPKFEVDGKKVSMEFESPLAQSQKLQKALAWQQMAESLGQVFGPQIAMQAFNLEKLPQYLGEAYGVPLELVKDDAQIQQLAQQAMQMAQQQAQQQQSQFAPVQQAALGAQQQNQLLQSEGV